MPDHSGASRSTADKLSPKERLFVEDYLVDLNATRAAINAGYSPRSAEVTGHRMLRKAKVREAVREAMAERILRTRVDQDRVIRELARVAFANVTDFANWDDDGLNFIPASQLDPGIAAAVKTVRDCRQPGQVVLPNGDSIVVDHTTRLIVMHDKIRALELLARHVGILP
jgi:phage terminase small subunit